MSIPYARFPAIHGDTVVFVAQDDLWSVPVDGGRARRLTTGAVAGSPSFSPDGTLLAYTNAAHHAFPEIHVLGVDSGRSWQLTWQGTLIASVSWSPDGRRIRYGSFAGSVREPLLWEVPVTGGGPKRLPEHAGAAIGSAGLDGPSFVYRGWAEPANWKRYRGGTTGAIWWDEKGTGEYRRILGELGGNLHSPRAALGRLFVLSDHEGVGNVYSCAYDASDLRRHSDHADFYARNLNTDGTRLAYHAGGALYVIDSAAADGQPRRIDVRVETPNAVTERRFVPAAEFTRSGALSPDGSRVAITARGKAFSFDVDGGPVLQHGDPDLTRYRDLAYLDDDRLIGLAADTDPDERLIILSTKGSDERRLNLDQDLGSVTEFAVSPDGSRLAVGNQRNELLLVDLPSETVRVLDRSPHGATLDPVFSPDGAWIAYRYPEEGTEPEGDGRASVKLCNVDSGECVTVADRVLHDFRPSFDPSGDYLYFIGYREFDPTYDATHLEIGFLKGSRPYAVELRPGLGSPFGDTDRETGAGIVVDGIGLRIHRFGSPDGRYKRVLGLPGKALTLSGVSSGELDRRKPSGRATGTLDRVDLATGAVTKIAEDVADVWLSADRSTMLYRSVDRWRVLPAGQAPAGDEGWLDLDRVKLRVRLADEWRQLFREAWQAQRDHFWDAEMSGVDWAGMYERYEPLLSTVATRRELGDLIWELQAELGTSHAYQEVPPVVSGDRRVPAYLGADLVYDAGVWRVHDLIDGDRWDPDATSPLHLAGIAEGDAILAVNGQPVTVDSGPEALLLNQAGKEVALTVQTGDAESRTTTVIPIADEYKGRYRDWANANTRKVHDATGGRVGYIHIPQLMPSGYATFMRAYLAEYGREALLVDVRNNGGGHLSALVLEKLARIRIGQTQWRTGRRQPYPLESPRGPVVGLINEFCGSDGDIFAQAFRLMGLGVLVGTRTWGGVVGSTHKQTFADNSNTVQPAMAISFDEVGWGVEGHGVDPDVHVDRAPQDYVEGRDPQLETAIALALEELARRPAYEHDVRPMPNRAARRLPPRS